MPPKKAQKTMALSDFLQDSSLGSWADEMDSLPTAPAPRADDGSRVRDFDNGRSGYNDYPPRESRYPPREELPLPTKPPYTAYVGNLAFDITERDVEEFFRVPLKSVKIIKDRDEKPKGFGYVEFETLDGLKEGLAKSGAQLASRTVRVSVAEPPKEREFRGGFDDDKFSSPWRREGPLPPLDRPSRGGGGSRFTDAPSADRGERMGFGSRFTPSSPRGPQSRDLPSTDAENNTDWRATARPRGPPPPTDRPALGPRKPSGFTPHEGPAHAAETEETWSKGSKFSPTPAEPPAARGKSPFFSKESGNRAQDDDTGDWRSGPRRGPLPPNGRTDRSPSESVPSTPNMGRRKLELLPRTSSQSTATSPVGSPKAATHNGIAVRANPFGAAKPVDATAREKEIEDKLAREREIKAKERPTDEAKGPPRSNERGGFFNRGGGTERDGGWRDRRSQDPPSTSGGNSRSASAAHSRATSYDGGSTTPPTVGGASAAKKPFSFAALASEEAVIEGEEDEPQADEAKKAVAVE